MSKKMITLMLAAVLMVGILIPVSSLAVADMYVYTQDGRTLNVRSSPEVGDNLIGRLNFGSQVGVEYHLGNGWTAIVWGGAYGTAYVQTRFLTGTKPSSRPVTLSRPSTPSDNAGTVTELNRIFKTYKRVDVPYNVVVRPTRASGWVNLRFAPTKSAELLATYRANEQLRVIAEFTGWYQVEDPATGNVGYISSQYVIR